jgi:uncharacterized Zn finger protein (UPF0148 family)
MTDPSQLLGQYLLQGWTMMGEACTTCDQGVPLMRSKAGDKLICVSCGKDYLAQTPSKLPEATFSQAPKKSMNALTHFSELLHALPSLAPCLSASIAALNATETPLEEKLQHAALLERLKAILSEL